MEEGSPVPKSRILVLCFDGTSNEYDGDNTNVVKFFSLLKKDNCDEQICYYQAGVGTYFNPGTVSPFFEWSAKILDLAFAWYLNTHVMDGYRFLMQNYHPNDKICIFGFSRGAYTARALAGMLFKIGLLSRDNLEQIPFAYKLYTRTDPEGVKLAQGYKKTYCHHVIVDFMGVWDTVASVGLIMTRTLPFTNSNKGIRVFRHALSLDERRAKFKANLFHRPPPGGDLSKASTEAEDFIAGRRNSLASLLKHRKKGDAKQQSLPPQIEVTDQGPVCDVLEVWFSGCHSDVGGGAVLNTEPQSLANITLRWMVRQVVESQCGIQFTSAAMAELAIPLITIPTIQDSRKPGLVQTRPDQPLDNQDRALDKVDASMPLHDELKIDPLWWILEIVPLTYYWQDKDGRWHKSWGPNWGRGRKIEDDKPKFHLTVKERMQDPKLKYKPNAIWKQGTEVYVE
ncbi:hypothetical protein Moror_10818 [Moniliophthora roreri MCA 2997]|uniref:T6SS Phospholipase effector Tle1-like catalytic domain-containing protein n=1 Tax=Moniliophthora roreri (strain MCA 2997) TaxID=1381753 RepID=V2WMC4_MONRO|nr:hypothetical protein Moror_10818 [Moniliophthora roreri MCA 2997]